MFLYKIATVGYEEYNPVELLHEQQFTNEQLLDMYISCIEQAYIESFAYLKGCDWDDDILSDFDTLDMIHHAVVKELIKKYGFKRIEYTAELAFWMYIDTSPKEQDELEEWNPSLENQRVKEELLRVAQKHRARILADIKAHHQESADHRTGFRHLFWPIRLCSSLLSKYYQANSCLAN